MKGVRSFLVPHIVHILGSLERSRPALRTVVCLLGIILNPGVTLIQCLYQWARRRNDHRGVNTHWCTNTNGTIARDRDRSS